MHTLADARLESKQTANSRVPTESFPPTCAPAAVFQQGKLFHLRYFSPRCHNDRLLSHHYSWFTFHFYTVDVGRFPPRFPQLIVTHCCKMMMMN